MKTFFFLFSSPVIILCLASVNLGCISLKFGSPAFSVFCITNTEKSAENHYGNLEIGSQICYHLSCPTALSEKSLVLANFILVNTSGQVDSLDSSGL